MGALVIAVLALLVNFLSYRASGRIVHLRARFDRSSEKLIIVAFNSGRADAEVEKLELRCPPNTTWKVIDLTAHLTEGPPLKHVLTGGKSARWVVDLRNAIEVDFDRGYWFVPASSHMIMAWTKPISPRVRLALSTKERQQSPFIKGLGRYGFKRLYKRLFWAKFPKGQRDIYRPSRIEW
jgi:hypothetical protein